MRVWIEGNSGIKHRRRDCERARKWRKAAVEEGEGRLLKLCFHSLPTETCAAEQFERQTRMHTHTVKTNVFTLFPFRSCARKRSQAFCTCAARGLGWMAQHVQSTSAATTHATQWLWSSCLSALSHYTVKLPARIRQACRAGLPDTPLLPLALATARPRWHARARKCCADAP